MGETHIPRVTKSTGKTLYLFSDVLSTNRMPGTQEILKYGCFQNVVKLGLTLTSSDEQEVLSTLLLMLGKRYK